MRPRPGLQAWLEGRRRVRRELRSLLTMYVLFLLIVALIASRCAR
ncbi:MAG: hypothetical protein U1E76_09020 [Planctomycetota bacterium]